MNSKELARKKRASRIALLHKRIDKSKLSDVLNEALDSQPSKNKVRKLRGEYYERVMIDGKWKWQRMLPNNKLVRVKRNVAGLEYNVERFISNDVTFHEVRTLVKI